MRRALRTVLALVTLVVVALIVSPLALYWVGLHGVERLPTPPKEFASAEQQQFVWQQAGGVGESSVKAMNPYVVTLRLFSPLVRRAPSDELVAWWVASAYLIEHQRYQGMGSWHLSGTALTIWLSRNWSREELMTAGVQALNRRGLTPLSSGQAQAALESSAHAER